MYNIVIFSGGTGSAALQRGFSAIYGNDNYNLDLIINAYDNGKSTGACRRVFGGRILGPSDLRKNHMTQFALQKSSRLADPSSRESALKALFELRFSAKDTKQYYKKARSLLEEKREAVGQDDTDHLETLLDYFFFDSLGAGQLRETLRDIEFEDFSLANIFYSSLAALNDFSLRAAGREMAKLLGIKDNVHLISDVSLYLKAKTASGHIIEDEGDIVEWDNPDDPIASVTLNRDGRKYTPRVDEGTNLSETKGCAEQIENADIIIFSSGTQWSSLIPTYIHRGLREMLEKSKARKYLVINNVEDHDMKGVSADKMIDILGRYIPLDGVEAVVNLDAAAGMNSVTRIKSVSGHIGRGAKHDPVKLVSLIMKDYFGVGQEDKTYIFDLDGTLWDERATRPGKAVGAENMNLFDGVILSGNSYEHVRDVFRYLYYSDRPVEIHSDYGNVRFTSEDETPEILSEEYTVDPAIVRELQNIPEFKEKVTVRGGGCVVTIKPLANREKLLDNALDILTKFGGIYEARISGRTSIDITR